MTRDQQRERTLNGALMCSLIHVAHVVLCVLVLVGVGGVTVVHIGHDAVLVVASLSSVYPARATLLIGESSNFCLLRPLMSKDDCSLSSARTLTVSSVFGPSS